jgi:uncharacterized protein YaiE (UPF0345 family)
MLARLRKTLMKNHDQQCRRRPSSIALNSATPSGTSPNIMPNRSSTNAGIGASVAGNLSFITAAVDRLEITSGGNVGIGTSTPNNRLTVWGSDTASSTSAFSIVNNASTTEFQVFDGGNAQLAGTLTQNSNQRLKIARRVIIACRD